MYLVQVLQVMSSNNVNHLFLALQLFIVDPIIFPCDESIPLSSTNFTDRQVDCEEMLRDFINLTRNDWRIGIPGTGNPVGALGGMIGECPEEPQMC